MDPFSFLLGIAVTGAAVAILWLGRKRPFQRIPSSIGAKHSTHDPFVELGGHVVRLRALLYTDEKRTLVPHVEYSVDLPERFRDIMLSDFDSQELRRSVDPATALTTLAPETSDVYFNDKFQLGAITPELATFLHSKAVRKTLLDFVDSFPAFSIHLGTVRIIEIGHLPELGPHEYGSVDNWPDAIQINVGLIVGLVDQLIRVSYE